MNTIHPPQDTAETVSAPAASVPVPVAVVTKPVKAPKSPELLDRDHSILAFNERVLERATRHDVPLLERLRYLCIVSSNLDEFFEVRAEPQLLASQPQRFARLTAAVHAIVEQQYALYNDK